MSSYRCLGPYPITPNGAMTGSAVITSQVFDARSMEGCAFAPKWTGTPTGTFVVLVSLDYLVGADGVSVLNAGTWNDIGASVTGNPTGGVGNTYIPVYASCTAYIKLQYTNASGSGLLSGAFLGKTRG